MKLNEGRIPGSRQSVQRCHFYFNFRQAPLTALVSQFLSRGWAGGRRGGSSITSLYPIRKGGGTLRFTSALRREGCVCVCVGGGGCKFDIGCTPLSVRLQSANRHSQTDRGALLLRAL